MQTEVEQRRDLAKAFYASKPMPCPKHPGAFLTGQFVHTTYFDHLVLTCPAGKETITIPQRPKQMEFNPQQVEGYVENIQRGDAILCYRCQSRLETAAVENQNNGVTDYTFTCVRCASYGRWMGRPELAKIGK
jgi:hypothetical protein